MFPWINSSIIPRTSCPSVSPMYRFPERTQNWLKRLDPENAERTMYDAGSSTFFVVSKIINWPPYVTMKMYCWYENVVWTLTGCPPSKPVDASYVVYDLASRKSPVPWFKFWDTFRYESKSTSTLICWWVRAHKGTSFVPRGKLT